MDYICRKETKRMKTVEVVAAIIEQNGKVLATQRGYGDYKDGWEFPGGKIEPGESKEEAIIREIKEELATEIEVIDFLNKVEHDYPTFHLTMYSFRCRIVKGDVKLLEHEDAKWLSKEELDTVAWLPADIAVVNELKEKL